MKSMTTSCRTVFRRLAVATVTLCICLWAGLALGQGIDPTHRFAWSENTGWQNFKSTHGEVSVYATHLEGHVWGENIGWIRLGSYTGGGTHTYGNTNQTNFGVNRTGNQLSGYAWGENIGWISFGSSVHHAGVQIDPATGDFSGFAWGENIGWIKFAGTAVDSTAYKVKLADTAPTVTTQAATSVTTSTATGNGNITNLGLPNPTAHGVCWSTTANPTTADSKTDKGAAAATGAFTSSMTGLTAGTTYHYRAYATNTVGTSYGENWEFTTSSTPSPTPHSVLYNGNGNTGGTVPADPNTYAETAMVTVLDNTGNLVKTGSVFAGWNSQTNGGGAQYAPGTTFSMPADNVTLYAQWSSSAVTITPTEKEHAPEATNGQTVTVTAGAGASWTATSNNDWITVTGGASGTGDGTVTYSLDSNDTGSPSMPRTGTISIADKTFIVTQGTYHWQLTQGPGTGCQGEISGGPYFVEAASLAASAPFPDDTAFPWGLIDFKIVNVPSGGTVTLTVTMTSNIPAGSIFYKYDSGTYTPYENVAGLDDGDNLFSITLTDGGAGDQDGQVNGEIVDPGGIGVRGAQPIPTLSEWGMIILACILAGLTLWRMRRQGLV
ncbi:MAG: IPTL-CTERM sorting domain-containing protein [Deltaproteobacteria bacterium]|nr:IPTL-CTERM sorting domain-containing protein [Deltaproteobacteria bacterium]